MAQQQRNVTLAAPGFKGLNTQDSPITQSHEFASIADNCIIDRYGRVGARKGSTVLTTDNSELSTNGIEAIHEFVATDGTKVIFSAGNNKILSGTTTLTDITPGSYTITANDWQMVTLNDHAFMFQRGHEPLIYEHSSTTLMKMSAKTGYIATVPQDNAVCSAYGRLWAADVTANKYTVYWTDSLLGWDWAGGSIDITEVWPNGTDEIVAIAGHNNYLLIFGKETIIVYGSSDATGQIVDPASDLVLIDAFSGIGCISRHTVKSVGRDLYFLDYSGVRSLGRLIQEKSLPTGDISRNVERDIQDRVATETAEVHGLFSPDESFYLVLFPTSLLVYCFDMRGLLEDGSARVTTWSGVSYESMTKLQDGTIYFGSTDGISTYDGYTDDSASYLMSYYSNPLTFGDPSINKIPKQVDLTVIGGENGSASLFWAYDYKTNYASQSMNFSSSAVSYYGVAEYGEDEYSLTGSISQKKINVTGSGTALTIGFEAAIDGAAVSVQEFNIQALVGRIL